MQTESKSPAEVAGLALDARSASLTVSEPVMRINATTARTTAPITMSIFRLELRAGRGGCGGPGRPSGGWGPQCCWGGGPYHGGGGGVAP
ncbi:hypothetical protein EXE63_02000 (plasmid) [Mycolicibacterium frederiksbergense]|uniref:Uncharacterized protein n=1 Tax=Mycolicibacterium frederiksbergense TaxID=117567 RepID=A0A6H0RX24_9MYCO|nr:hypothetical protein EXE63_02000 [Mycolicibacterium frederiksbergense]